MVSHVVDELDEFNQIHSISDTGNETPLKVYVAQLVCESACHGRMRNVIGLLLGSQSNHCRFKKCHGCLCMYARYNMCHGRQ